MTTAKEIKSRLLTHALYRLKFEGAVTEYGGKGVIGVADVLAILPTGRTHEFEVKVEAGDLLSELKAVDILTNRDAWESRNYLDEKGVGKLDKHVQYLKTIPPGEPRWGGRSWERTNVPNKFSFAVPPEFEAQAMKALQFSPYGLWVIAEDPRCAKRAAWLHTEIDPGEIRMNIMRKACTELEITRRQLLEKQTCSKCYKALPMRCESCKAADKESRDYHRRSSACWKKVEGMPEEMRGPAYTECMREAS